MRELTAGLANVLREHLLAWGALRGYETFTLPLWRRVRVQGRSSLPTGGLLLSRCDLRSAVLCCT